MIPSLLYLFFTIFPLKFQFSSILVWNRQSLKINPFSLSHPSNPEMYQRLRNNQSFLGDSESSFCNFFFSANGIVFLFFICINELHLTAPLEIQDKKRRNEATLWFSLLQPLQIPWMNSHYAHNDAIECIVIEEMKEDERGCYLRLHSQKEALHYEWTASWFQHHARNWRKRSFLRRYFVRNRLFFFLGNSIFSWIMKVSSLFLYCSRESVWRRRWLSGGRSGYIDIFFNLIKFPTDEFLSCLNKHSTPRLIKYFHTQTIN